MGFFDFFKKNPSTKQVVQDDIYAEIHAKRLAELQPVTSRGFVKNAPLGFDHFNLNDVLVGTVRGEHEWYLFDGNNAAELIYDLRQLNKLASEASLLVPEIPDLSIQNVEIVTEPFPGPDGQWLFSRIIVEPLTETGKLKKYPVCALVQTISGKKSARLFYTLDGIIGKGSVSKSLNTHSGSFTSYGFDFINGVISHVWKNTNQGKEMLYNKSKK